jgi:oligogalacturonide lyase
VFVEATHRKDAENSQEKAMRVRICGLILAVGTFAAWTQAQEGPSEWIDKSTGHRVIRLSKEPGSASLYFHQNAYTPDGNKMIISTPGGLSALNLKTREIELIVPGIRYSMGSSSGIEVGRKTPTVYYQRQENGAVSLYATNIETKETRKVATVNFPGADIGGVNADETLIVGKCRAVAAAPAAAPTPEAAPATQPGARRGGRGGRGGGGGGMLQFFTANIKTGEVKTFFPMTDNLNHHQTSPTDPNMILYCHEGEWHQVDRIWTIHTDGTGNKLMHPRTMEYEIAGHEFFSHDGKQVWYDLQTPRSSVFWLAAVNVYTGERIRYPIDRSVWGVHYNESWDGKLFSSDGGGPDSVANMTPLPEARRLGPPQNGQWIYLLKPQNVPPEIIKVNGEDVKVGKFDVEKLVDLSKHNYSKGGGVEPNATFTPDGKMIIFRSTMEGALHVYGVELAKP